MSGRFVRASKYRHVFGRPTRKEQCYDNLRISRNAWDTNLVKANPRYISVNWEASGGGAFAVIPIEEKGRLPEQIPLFRGHTAVVLDTDWSPFDDCIIASGSDDGKAFVWRVPTDYKMRTDEEDHLADVSPIRRLAGHTRKVGHVLFNPCAENTLATSSGDYTIKLWDIEAGVPKLTLKHEDLVQGLSWSANGSLMVTTSRDKKLRIWDVRQEKAVNVGPGHAGAKNSRVVWLGERDRIATTGFSKMSDRQLGLWDLRNANQPMDGFDRLDSQSGVCMPFWDDGTQCLYLAGRGDGNIRYYEYQNDRFEFLSEYKSADPQRGVAFLPKRGVRVHENEVMRAFKTVNDSYIEPISFIVPRRAEVFQDDIFPPAVGNKPGMSAAEWIGGENRMPPKIDLAAVYAERQPEGYVKPASDLQTLSPEKSRPIEEPITPITPSQDSIKRKTPSIKEQTASMMDMTGKYRDDEAADDSASSFEEISQPSASNAVPTDLAEASHVAASQSTETQIKAQSASASSSAAAIPVAASSTVSPTKTSLSSTSDSTQSSVQHSLAEIKDLLAQQALTMSRQNETINRLTHEVETLRGHFAE